MISIIGRDLEELRTYSGRVSKPNKMNIEIKNITEYRTVPDEDSE
jgi:hypothetical protein